MLAIAPYKKKPSIYDDYVFSFLIVSSNEHPNFEINQFTSFEELVKMDSERQERGFHLKSIDRYQNSGDLTTGVAMWHFQTEFLF